MTYPVAWLILDLLLIAALLVLAYAALHSRQLRQAVIVYIAFGLTAALTWARLRAPDVALAEAAIGAGLAGALMLAALRDRPAGEADDAEARDSGPGRQVRWLVGLATTALTLGVGWAFVSGLDSSDGQRLAGIVRDNLAASGVENPVTAVLLNFRAFDTLLELAVLLAALLGILALGPARRGYRRAGPVFAGLMTWLVPLLILAAGYQLWVGAHAPGGAFQAGALLAAAGVIAFLAGRSRAGLPQGTALRLLTVSGVAVFTLVGLGTLFTHGALLHYPQDWSGALILLIEVFATLAIAATLVLSYVGGEPAAWRTQSSEDDSR